MAENLPVRRPVLDRAALERVLARAAELQSRSDDDGALTEAEVLDLAKEVGLTGDAVRQALAEESTRADVAEPGGFAAAYLGSAVVRASRTVRGAPAATLASLDAWMQRNESLQVKRRFAAQLDWEAREDFFSAMWRALRLGGRGFHLSRATEVRAVVSAADASQTQVMLAADFSGARGQRAVAAIATAATGVIVGVPLLIRALDAGLTAAAVLSLVPALALPVGAFAIARQGFRALLARGSVALEQALDRLEFGDGAR